MGRYAAYPDTTSGYIVVDTIRDRIVALYADHRPAEHAARRLNDLAVDERTREAGADACRAMLALGTPLTDPPRPSSPGSRRF
jgi:hypothetical protein